MQVPEMDALSGWIGSDTISQIEDKRRKVGEIQREGKFSTKRMIWLFLHVANSGRSSLFEIVETALSQQRTLKTLTESGFCKARARFSPQMAE